MPEFVRLEKIADHIALLTLDRPAASNALSQSLLNDLNTCIAEINQDKSVICTILTGAGDKAFCAGADLKERRTMNNKETIQTVQYIGKTINAIANMNMPVIAALNGAAFGGGLELALACDIRIGAANAKMGLTETSLAIIPGAGGTQRLPRLIGLGQAKRLIYTAQPVTAKEALDIRLIEQMCEPSELLDTAAELASLIAKNGPIALNQAKKAIDSGMQSPLDAGLQFEHACYKETIPTEDRKEGLAAFKEKRTAVYTGK